MNPTLLTLLFCLLATCLLGPATLHAGPVSAVSYDGKDLRFKLTQPGLVRLEIQLPDGTRLALPFLGYKEAGEHAVPWSGMDNKGQNLPKGDYTAVVTLRQNPKPNPNFGNKGFLQLTNPTCIRVDARELDANGDFYVLDFSKKGPPAATASSDFKKFNDLGRPVLDFPAWYGAKPTDPKLPQRLIPRFATWVELTPDGNFLFAENNAISQMHYNGKPISSFGGFEWLYDSATGKYAARTGSAWPLYGIAQGKANRIYIRDRKQIHVYDRSKPGFEGYLYSSPATLPPPPVPFVTVSPCIACDKDGKIYVSSVNGLSRLTDTGKELRHDYDTPSDPTFKEPIGLTLSADGTIYIIDRGLNLQSTPGAPPTPSVRQFRDDGKSLSLVWRFEDPRLTGLRDVALSPNESSLYLLEDGDDFSRRYTDEGYEEIWPARRMQGKSRLFRYDFTFSQPLKTIIHLH